MASITIRNLDDDLKARLRVRAASHGRSMEDEVRVILRAAEPPPTPVDGAEWVNRIRERVAVFGGVDLQIPPREPMREPPSFE